MSPSFIPEDDAIRVDRATVETAHARMDTHEAVCAERYRMLEDMGRRIEVMLLALQSDVHGRLNTLSNRMWTWVTGVLGGSVVALGALSFFLLTRGMK